ncbi:MAG TPA: YwiC-like family protein [bacterium]
MKTPFTREHGSYGMAIASFIIGAGTAGKFSFISLTTLGGIILLIMAKFPLSIIIQRRNLEKGMTKRIFFWAFIFTFHGLMLLAPLLKILNMEQISLLGILAVSHAAIYFFAIAIMKERTLPAEIAGISTIALSGIFGYVSAGGTNTATALMLWLIILLYYSASVFKVRSLVDKGRKEFFRKINFIYPVTCILVTSAFAYFELIPYLVLLSFIPLLENIYSNFSELNYNFNRLRKVGWTEVLKSAVFGIILIITIN